VFFIQTFPKRTGTKRDSPIFALPYKLGNPPDSYVAGQARTPLSLTFLTTDVPVTKAEVVTKIAQKTGVDKGDVSATIEAFIKVVKNAMIEGENIYIRGFGSFVIKKRAAKVAQIIKRSKAGGEESYTTESIHIPEYAVPSFKPSKSFISKVKTGTTIK
jgi:DNA-binding protein HU-beta